jgi:hypothetical protein
MAEDIKSYDQLKVDDFVLVEWKYSNRAVKSHGIDKQVIIGKVKDVHTKNGPVFISVIACSDSSLVKPPGKVGLTSEILEHVVKKIYTNGINFKFTKLQKLKESEAAIYLV